MESAPCKKCAEKISTDATRCPNCGYEPAKGNRLKRLAGYLLALLMLPTIILTPVSIIIFYYITKDYRARQDARPTTFTPQ